MRVLVVEDERVLADRVAEGLRDEGMAVDVAYDGVAALEKAAVNRYEVVVLDRDLPGVHGDAVCVALGAGDHSPLVLMLTASGAVDERIAGLRLGADDYLAKPFAFAELVLRIRALVRRGTPQPRQLRTGDLVLVPGQRTVSRGDRTIVLSRREFAVLEVLLRAEGRVVGSEELLEQVWDEHADPFTNAVRMTVARLRAKLGDPPLITTVVGDGYQL